MILYKLASCHLFFFFKLSYVFSIPAATVEHFYFFSANEEDEIILNVDCHYSQAKVGRRMFSIGDCAFIKVALPLPFTTWS